MTMRRCDSMAKESSSSSAASALSICRSNGSASIAHAPSSRCTSSPSTANRNAVARNSGARNTRSLADTVSISAMPAPASTSFAASSSNEQGEAERRLAGGQPPRDEQCEADADVVEELQCRGPFHQRQMARRILEQHGLVNHRQLEMRRRIVDRDARVLGQQHHRECDGGEGEARIQRRAPVWRAARRSPAAPWSRRSARRRR